MKKLNLNLTGSIQSLTKEQMKKINGGYGPTCGINCYLHTEICTNGTDGCIGCWTAPLDQPFNWICGDPR